ncbi:MAG TPA: hypothetical protein VFQ61_05915 [Polyangiaceae bacterium]|nr:hypothetical protein [Polyangiaceae bacterium]
MQSAEDVEAAGVQCSPTAASLEGRYHGLGSGVSCEAELQLRMKQVSRALGVDCPYCHAGSDYARDTERKRIANWMAIELAPKLREKGSGRPARCSSCHLVDGVGRAKLLGNPRAEPVALEWMNTHMVADFVTQNGALLRCKTCHRAQFGAPGFARRLILTSNPIAGTSSAPLPE